MKRLAVFALLLAAVTLVPASAQNFRVAPVRIGLTPVFLDDQAAFLGVWRGYLEERLKRQVVFVQRGSYREITDMLRRDDLDFAWICGAPFVANRSQLRLLAVPVFNGKPLYQSYLIVPTGDTQTRALLDLRGKIFAYADPDSNSGHLYTQFVLLQHREKPATFFGKTFFTWGHRKIVEAVATGLANGGAVDSYVWETLQRVNPELTTRTRVVEKSPYFGHTPIVARRNVAPPLFDTMQRTLLGMDTDAEGRALLRKLNLDGFVRGQPTLFDSIGAMQAAVNRNDGAATP